MDYSPARYFTSLVPAAGCESAPPVRDLRVFSQLLLGWLLQLHPQDGSSPEHLRRHRQGAPSSDEMAVMPRRTSFSPEPVFNPLSSS
jgi:hypothetical protein